MERDSSTPFAIRLDIVDAKMAPTTTEYSAGLVLSTSDGQRVLYKHRVGHGSFYGQRPALGLGSDELAHCTSGGSGGYAEDVSIRRTSATALRVRIYGERVGVGVTSKPERVQEFVVKVPADAAVTVDCEGTTAQDAPNAVRRP